MNINLSKLRGFRPWETKNCLKPLQSCRSLVIVCFLFAGCGKVINKELDPIDLKKNVSFLLMENTCYGPIPPESPVSKEIKELYKKAVLAHPGSFFTIPPRSYDFANPMIVSLDKMNSSLQNLSAPSLMRENAREIHYLYNESQRFEDQKCSLKSLSEKKKYDIRPFLNIAHQCSKKNNSEVCEDSEFQSMSLDDPKWTRENTLELCKMFAKEIHCHLEYRINQKNNSVGSMVNRYYKRFQNERFSTLFKLRSTHQKYHCEKKDEEKTVMTIKILEGTFPARWLKEVLDHVEASWSNKNFALKFELVRAYGDDVVTIVPTGKRISYVPDDNNRMVYLSTLNDMETTKKILAHEFGHVLGFPDCYIEFFDDSKKELVYYEISKENTNIMCSLKDGVVVPEDYLQELQQKSCLFN